MWINLSCTWNKLNMRSEALKRINKRDYWFQLISTGLVSSSVTHYCTQGLVGQWGLVGITCTQTPTIHAYTRTHSMIATLSNHTALCIWAHRMYEHITSRTAMLHYISHSIHIVCSFTPPCSTLLRLAGWCYLSHKIGWVKKGAPCEDRTHDLQIMRLTRCLLR